ncbi:hypothetical protein MHYP_G00241730 [Metynnis hypsauchen]
MSRIRVGTLNVNGARDVYKRALIYELIKQKGVDVKLLQETHSDGSNETDWRKEWESEALFSHMSSTRAGVAVLFAKEFLPISYEVQHVIDGRFMVVKAQYERFLVYFVNVYAPTVGTDRQLEGEILDLQSLIDSTGDQSHTANLKSKRSALANLLGFRAQGALVRSCYQSLTQMDAPSKFFFNLERKNGQSRFIHSLRSEDGQELIEPVDIRKRAVRFYSELYGNELEPHAALQSMKVGTVPGIDGLPVEFYKAFWAEIGADWLAVLNETLAEGSLPLSCRRVVITLLPKKGDLQDIKNWRPAKLAVYNSRRNKVENRSGRDVLPLFLALVKSRIVFEFKFYEVMSNLEVFEYEWCYNNVLCTVVNGELILASPWD